MLRLIYFLLVASVIFETGHFLSSIRLDIMPVSNAFHLLASILIVVAEQLLVKKKESLLQREQLLYAITEKQAPNFENGKLQNLPEGHSTQNNQELDAAQRKVVCNPPLNRSLL